MSFSKLGQQREPLGHMINKPVERLHAGEERGGAVSSKLFLHRRPSFERRYDTDGGAPLVLCGSECASVETRHLDSVCHPFVISFMLGPLRATWSADVQRV